MAKRLFLFLSFLFLAALLPVERGKAQCPNFEEWTEYQCASVGTCRAESPNQNNNVMSRDCWIPGIEAERMETRPECTTDPITEEKICKNVEYPVTYCAQGAPTCGPPAISQNCGVSRVCSGESSWKRTPTDQCSCAGKCYVPPNLKPLDHDLLSPKNVFGEDGKVKLPVNVGWDETAEEQIVAKDACSIGSYRYQITEGAGNAVFGKAVINPRISCDPKANSQIPTSCGAVFEQAYKNEDGAMMNKAHAIADKNRGYVSTPDGKDPVKRGAVSPTYNYLTGAYDYVLGKASELLQALVRNPQRSCILTPGKSYAMRIKTCADQAGADCGKSGDRQDRWSNPLSFSTYPAPELISPFDQDFEGLGNSNPDIPVTLRWCPDPAAQSYSIHLARKATPAELEETGIAEIRIPLDPIVKEETSYIDETAWREIKNRVQYYWQIVSCAATRGKQCAKSSQRWGIFSRNAFDIPQGLTSSAKIVNTTSILAWNETRDTPLYFVHIREKGEEGKNIYGTTRTRSFQLETIWKDLLLNTEYQWRVTACPLEATKASECTKDESGQIGWSDFASFATTGAPPEVQLNPLKEGIATLPLEITWNPVPGALSYNYSIEGVKTGYTTETSLKAVLASSNDTGTFQLNLDAGYALKVASCASENGTNCGAPAIQQFMITRPQQPEPIAPAASQTIQLPEVKLEWKPNLSGTIHRYAITYLSPGSSETNSSCLEQVDKEIASDVVTGTKTTVRLACAGKYEARVAGCMDSACSQKGEEAVWTFSATANTQRNAFAGLVPCGKSKTSIPRPPWNELEPCEFRHIFLLGKILLDFLLYSATPTLVVLFALYTGVIAYFSVGSPDILAKIKGIWRAIGIGVLIMFFAWMFMNLLLGILDFNVTVFGRWYEMRLK